MMKLVQTFRTAAKMLCCAAAASLAFPAQAADRQQAEAKQLSAACSAIEHVDRSRLPAPAAIRSGRFQSEARVGRLRPNESADPLITVEVRPSGPSRNPVSSYWAWKDEKGWIVSRAAYLESRSPGLPWAHEAGLEAYDLPESNWTLTEGRLSSDDTRRLEALLASKCLADEPPTRPLNLPLKGGGEVPCRWHPTSTEVQIRQGSTLRRFSHSCSIFASDLGAGWPSDLIIGILARARLEPHEAGAFEPIETDIVPPAFRGRWSMEPHSCAQPLELGETEAAYGGLRRPIDSIRMLGDRTIVLQGDWPVFGMESVIDAPRGQQILLLSPEGDRIAWDRGFAFVLRRCS